MKSPSPALWSTVLALVFGIISPRTTAAAESVEPTPKRVEANQASPSATALMRTAYLSLVKDSIVPADPHTVANAALKAMATLAPDRKRPPLPANFGHDAERDATWLGEQSTNLTPSCSVGPGRPA